MKRFLAVLLITLCLAFIGYAQTPDYTNFKPVFQEDIFVLNPYVPDPNSQIQKKTQVNPVYALSETSALELAVVLKDYSPVVIHSGPFGWLSRGQFSVTRSVPWLLFPDGSLVNAGLVASYFSHGYPANFIIQSIKQDFKEMAEYTAANPTAYDNIARLP